MTNVPPPHERRWRHPSELATPAPPPPRRGSRLTIGALATGSFVLVAGLAVLVVPRSTDTPGIASDQNEVVGQVAAAVSEVVAGGAETPTATEMLGLTDADHRQPQQLAAFGPPSRPVLATPIDTSTVVTTSSALAGRQGIVRVRMPAGGESTAEVVADAGGVVYLRLDPATTIEYSPLSLEPHPIGPPSAAAPDRDLWFAIVGSERTPVDPTAIGTAAFPDGTPIVTTDGRLIGLCGYPAGDFQLMPVGLS